MALWVRGDLLWRGRGGGRGGGVGVGVVGGGGGGGAMVSWECEKLHLCVSMMCVFVCVYFGGGWARERAHT